MTQNDEVLKYLKTGKSLSARVASRLLYVDRLAARIYDLRRQGYKVLSISQTRRSKRTGKPARYCLYKLITARKS